jgi:hypothetical protein
MLEEEWNKALMSNPNGACLEARWKKARRSQGASNCLEARWVSATASNQGQCLQARWAKAQASIGSNVNCLEARWKSAEASAYNGDCLQARLDGTVEVRDSKHPDGAVVTVTPEDWELFLAGALGGEYHKLSLPPLEFTDAEWAAFLDGAGKGEFALPPVEAHA